VRHPEPGVCLAGDAALRCPQAGLESQQSSFPQNGPASRTARRSPPREEVSRPNPLPEGSRLAGHRLPRESAAAATIARARKPSPGGIASRRSGVWSAAGEPTASLPPGAASHCPRQAVGGTQRPQFPRPRHPPAEAVARHGPGPPNSAPKRQVHPTGQGAVSRSSRGSRATDESATANGRASLGVGLSFRASAAPVSARCGLRRPASSLSSSDPKVAGLAPGVFPELP
jgi:hypothetical protein